MKQDKFLLAIVIGIGIIAVAVVALTLARRNDQYRTDETPEAIVQNYILALQKKDYERAYALLADKPHQPDFDTFRQDMIIAHSSLNNSVFRLELLDSNETSAVVTIIQSQNGMIESYRSDETARLVQQPEGWRIESMPYPFWGWNWYQETPKP